MPSTTPTRQATTFTVLSTTTMMFFSPWKIQATTTKTIQATTAKTIQATTTTLAFGAPASRSASQPATVLPGELARGRVFPTARLAATRLRQRVRQRAPCKCSLEFGCVCTGPERVWCSAALRVLPHVAALFSLRLRELMQHCELMHPSASSCCLRPSARRPRPCVRANTS